MPSIYELKKSLSLKPGEILGDFIIRDVEATMDEKRPRELYNFKVHLWLAPHQEQGKGKAKKGAGHTHTHTTNLLENAKNALIETAQKREIMYSSYGSPYHVHLEHVKAEAVGGGKKGEKGGEGEENDQEEGLIEIQALAIAKRRRDLPRLSQQEHASSEEEEASADDEMKRQGYRVVKAHFKSSQCGLCGREFVPGEHIAKPQGEKSRGGWGHVTCLANRMEEEGGGGKE